jgi:hypothetical protein
MVSPFIRRANNWQFLSSPEQWTLLEEWEEKKDEKRSRSVLVLVFFNSLQERHFLTGLDYDPVQLYGGGSWIDLQYGSYCTSLIFLHAQGLGHHLAGES